MPEPLPPTLVADRFGVLGDHLVELLRSLTAEQWDLPTVCPAWSVRDVAAHLLDTACRTISIGRDGFAPPPPDRAIESYGHLVSFLNDLNARWVAACRRLSPALLTDFMALVEPGVAAYFLAVDPDSPAAFPVAWAGEDESPAWFHVARELTERWHHQQQIRLAVGAPPLDDPWLSAPIFDTFLRALPFRYRDVEAPAGAALALRILGRQTYAYTLRREGSGWSLLVGEPAEPAARITLDEEPAWLQLTKGMPAAEAERRARIEGDRSLAAPYFHVLAIMG